MFGIMKHSNALLCYGISFSLYCLIVIASTQQPCPLPDIPADGEYSFKQNLEENKFLPGDTVSYSCTSGYMLVGKESRKCLFNGSWSDRPPFCDHRVKLKEPVVSNMYSPTSISNLIDGNSSSCFTWSECTGCTLHLDLDNKAVVHTIGIYLMPGSTNIRIFSGEKPCHDYNGHIRTSQWVLINCKSNGAQANRIKIANIASKSTSMTICEIQVYAMDGTGCEHPPEIRVSNGYFKFSRSKATLICEDGYKSKNGRLVCERNSWENFTPSCEENLCDAKVSNSTLTDEEGEWKFLDPVNKISTGTWRQLKCNAGYKLTGGPKRVTCQKNGMWTKTNATCIKEDQKTPKNTIIMATVGALVAIIILAMLGITLYLIRKQRKREVVVVYRSTDNITLPASENEYSTDYYQTMLPRLPVTPRPPALPPIMDDVYSLPEDCIGTTIRKSAPADIAFGTLKESSIYEN